MKNLSTSQLEVNKKVNKKIQTNNKFLFDSLRLTNASLVTHINHFSNVQSDVQTLLEM